MQSPWFSVSSLFYFQLIYPNEGPYALVLMWLI